MWYVFKIPLGGKSSVISWWRIWFDYLDDDWWYVISSYDSCDINIYMIQNTYIMILKFTVWVQLLVCHYIWMYSVQINLTGKNTLAQANEFVTLIVTMWPCDHLPAWLLDNINSGYGILSDGIKSLPGSKFIVWSIRPFEISPVFYSKFTNSFKYKII